MKRPPLVLGLGRVYCYPCHAERECELAYTRNTETGASGPVRSLCLICGRTDHSLPLAIAGAVLLDKREGSG